MDKNEKKIYNRKKRKARCRKKIFGAAERPRLSVFRSARHIQVQVIDDGEARTLIQASSFEKGLRISANIEGCRKIGERVARKCIEKGIQSIVFDRNGFGYHGRIKAVADGAREGGLNF